jgi:hypothetical protein
MDALALTRSLNSSLLLPLLLLLLLLHTDLVDPMMLTKEPMFLRQSTGRELMDETERMMEDMEGNNGGKEMKGSVINTGRRHQRPSYVNIDGFNFFQCANDSIN